MICADACGRVSSADGPIYSLGTCRWTRGHTHCVAIKRIGTEKCFVGHRGRNDHPRGCAEGTPAVTAHEDVWKALVNDRSAPAIGEAPSVICRHVGLPWRLRIVHGPCHTVERTHKHPRGRNVVAWTPGGVAVVEVVQKCSRPAHRRRKRRGRQGRRARRPRRCGEEQARARRPCRRMGNGGRGVHLAVLRGVVVLDGGARMRCGEAPVFARFEAGGPRAGKGARARRRHARRVCAAASAAAVGSVSPEGGRRGRRRGRQAGWRAGRRRARGRRSRWRWKRRPQRHARVAWRHLQVADRARLWKGAQDRRVVKELAPRVALDAQPFDAAAACSVLTQGEALALWYVPRISDGSACGHRAARPDPVRGQPDERGGTGRRCHVRARLRCASMPREIGTSRIFFFPVVLKKYACPRL